MHKNFRKIVELNLKSPSNLSQLFGVFFAINISLASFWPVEFWYQPHSSAYSSPIKRTRLINRRTIPSLVLVL